MSLRVEVIERIEHLHTVRDEWDDLLARAGNEVPFLTPEWLTTWWEILRQDRPLIRDHLRIQLVRTTAGTLVGAMPFMLTERPGSGWLRARTLGFLGADPYLTEHRAPLVDPVHGAEVGRAVASDLLARDDWDWIAWTGMNRESPFTREVERAMGIDWLTTDTGNLVSLAPTWEEFRASRKRNVKESLRHGYNSLRREGLSSRLEVAETAETVAPALERFFHLHALRATQAGLQHPDRFAGEGPRRFLRAVCSRFVDRGAARVFTLYVGEAPVASRVGFMLPGCLYLYYSGYDPAWARYGVMTTTVAEAMKYAIAHGVPTVHLSMGSDESKARWSPRTPVFHTARTVHGGWKSRAAVAAYTWGRDAADRGAVAKVLQRHL